MALPAARATQPEPQAAFQSISTSQSPRRPKKFLFHSLELFFEIIKLTLNVRKSHIVTCAHNPQREQRTAAGQNTDQGKQDFNQIYIRHPYTIVIASRTRIISRWSCSFRAGFFTASLSALKISVIARFKNIYASKY
jgi:hypothetical protein